MIKTPTENPNLQSAKKFAVIGNPVKHSLSPKIHQLFAKQFGINLSYQAIETEILEFERVVKDFFNQGGVGLNITVPFKLRAFILSQLSDEISEICSASNTLEFKDEKIIAHNTDGSGLIEDLKNNGISLENQKILIIGAGGATRGVLMSIIGQKPQSVTISNRSLENAKQLADEFQSYFQFQIASFNQINEKFDVIINATSLSLLNDVPNINCANYQDAVCYDLVYQLKTDTAFKRIAKRYGASKSLDGLGMLVEQAALSFKIWHGKMPETAKVLGQLKSELN